MAEGRKNSDKGRVLVIGDSDDTIEVVGEILAENGFEVGWAGHAHEAVMLYEVALERKDPYDVVLIDLAALGAGAAAEAVADLIATDAGVKAIALGGDAEYRSEYWRHGFKGMMPKPCKSTELVTEIHRVIGEAAA